MFGGRFPSRETQVRFARFLVVGGSAAAVQFAVLVAAKRMLAPTLAFTVSFVCSTSTHYTLNRFWALPSDRQDSWKQFLEYLVAAGLSYLINVGLFRLCLDVLGLGVLWSGIAALPPSTFIVFVLLNFRVFRPKRDGHCGG